MAAAIVLGAALLWALGDQPPDPVAPGTPAPDFRLTPLDGGPPVALSDLRGRVVLVNVWATWCKPCEDEMPAMERLYRRLRDQGFELLAVSIDEEREPVVAFRDRMGLTFPILLDPEGEVARRYQTTGVPESFLIDARGRVVAKYVGPRDWDAPHYEARIREVLGEAAAGQAPGRRGGAAAAPPSAAPARALAAGGRGGYGPRGLASGG